MNKSPKLQSGKRLLCCAAAAMLFLFFTSAHAALLNIVNPSFELPADIKHSLGYDAVGTTNDVPGWTNSGTIYTDEGVQKASGGVYGSGAWMGYMRGDNDGVYQITTNAFVPGVTYTLFCRVARTSTANPAGNMTNLLGIISAPTAATVFGNTTFVASTTNFSALGANVYTNITVSYTAQAADAGKLIGIYIDDIGAANAYMLVDDVRLIAGLIASQPQGANVVGGGRFTLSVAVSNAVGSVSYQWKHGPVGGPYTNALDGGNVSGATTATLTNAGFVSGDLGGYVVTVNDTVTSETSAEAVVTSINSLVVANPGFEIPMSVPAKQAGGFDVTNDDVPGWLNANLITTNLTGPVYLDSGFETGGSSSGAYEGYCRARDGGAYQWLNYIVQPGDHFTLSWKSHANNSVDDGWQVVQFVSGSADGSTAYTNATILASSEGVSWRGQNGFTNNTLEYIAAPEDVGKRLGIYFNASPNSPHAGNFWISFDDFSVAGNALTILAQPQSQTNFANATTTFSVTASTGNNPLLYQWKHGPVGGPFTNLADVGDISGSATSTLTISPTTTNDAGGYICTIADAAPSITNTAEADLTVLVLTNLYFTTVPPVLKYGAPGVSYQMQVFADYQNGTTSNNVSSAVAYSIDDPGVATVNATGGVTVVGIDAGPTTVTATYLGTSITQSVTLLQPTALRIVPSVSSYPPLYETGPSQLAKVYADFGTTYTNVDVSSYTDPYGAGGGTVGSQWQSDNGSVFYVSGSASGGLVTPVQTGTANLSVSFTPLTTSTNLSVAVASPLYQLLQNASFEQPGAQKITWGYDAAGTNVLDIPNWMDAADNSSGTNYIDSGVESSSPSDGAWAAYCRAGEGGGYQIGNYQITNGDTFYLIWSAQHTGGNAGASTEQVSLLSAPVTSTPYAGTTALNSDNSVLPGIGTTPANYTNIYITYQATANDAGKFIGAFFKNAGNPTNLNALANNYASFDNFVLAVKPLSAAPTAPGGLIATPGTGSIALNWTATGGASSYYVKRSTASGAEVSVANVSSNYYSDTAVVNGTTYYYVVSATNSFGASGNSTEVSDMTLPSIAPNPTIQISASQLIVNWSSGTLLQATNVTGPWSPVPNANPPSYTNTSYSGKSQEFYRVSVP